MDETTDYPDKEESGEWTETEARETPVPDYRCVWCKLPRAEWDESVPAHELDTGEALCGTCLRDLRYYKRVLSVQIVAHDGFGPAVKQAIDRHLRNLMEEVRELTDTPPDEEIIRPPMDSNASVRAPSQGRHPAMDVPPGIIALNEEDLTDEEVDEIMAIVDEAGG